MTKETLDYNGLIEDWKLELIIDRAKRFGIPKHDWPDVQQSAVLDILKFEYDAGKNNTAKENTILTAIIDHKIISLIRKESLHQKTFEEYLERKGYWNTDQECFCYAVQYGFREDLQHALMQLDDQQRFVCLGLIDGLSMRKIAQKLKCRQSAIKQIIDSIRDIFEQLGVNEWLR